MDFQQAEEPVGAAAAFGSLFRPEHELNIFQVSLGCSESLGLSIKRVTSTVLKRNPEPRPFYVYPSTSSQKNDVSRHEFEPSEAHEQRPSLFGYNECVGSTVQLSPLSQPTRRIQPSHCPTQWMSQRRYNAPTPTTEEFLNKHTQMKHGVCFVTNWKGWTGTVYCWRNHNSSMRIAVLTYVTKQFTET